MNIDHFKMVKSKARLACFNITQNRVVAVVIAVDGAPDFSRDDALGGQIGRARVRRGR